jgi:5'-nucleotidase
VPPFVFAGQPFRNQPATLTLTGAQIGNMLEQQWLDPKRIELRD